MRELLANGIIPGTADAQKRRKEGTVKETPEALKKERAAVANGFLEDRTTEASSENFDLERDFIIAGQAVGGMKDVIPAAELVERMMEQLVTALSGVPAVATVTQQANL